MSQDAAEQQTDESEADGQDTEAVEQERAERLDPENRPDEAEVDNTDRTFDAEVGAFTDSEHYDAQDQRFEPEETSSGDGPTDQADGSDQSDQTDGSDGADPRAEDDSDS